MRRPPISLLLVSLTAQIQASWPGTFGPVNQRPMIGSGQGRPNIVFILTDDQDLHMQSLNYMPFVKRHLIDHGTSYRRHFCTTALCCPSRVSLWTGKAAHNTNVTDVSPPYGKVSLHSASIIANNCHRRLSEVC